MRGLELEQPEGRGSLLRVFVYKCTKHTQIHITTSHPSSVFSTGQEGPFGMKQPTPQIHNAIWVPWSTTTGLPNAMVTWRWGMKLAGVIAALRSALLSSLGVRWGMLFAVGGTKTLKAVGSSTYCEPWFQAADDAWESDQFWGHHFGGALCHHQDPHVHWECSASSSFFSGDLGRCAGYHCSRNLSSCALSVSRRSDWAFFQYCCWAMARNPVSQSEADKRPYKRLHA